MFIYGSKEPFRLMKTYQATNFSRLGSFLRLHYVPWQIFTRGNSGRPVNVRLEFVHPNKNHEVRDFNWTAVRLYGVLDGISWDLRLAEHIARSTPVARPRLSNHEAVRLSNHDEAVDSWTPVRLLHTRIQSNRQGLPVTD